MQVLLVFFATFSAITSALVLWHVLGIKSALSRCNDKGCDDISCDSGDKRTDSLDLSALRRSDGTVSAQSLVAKPGVFPHRNVHRSNYRDRVRCHEISRFSLNG